MEYNWFHTSDCKCDLSRCQSGSRHVVNMYVYTNLYVYTKSDGLTENVSVFVFMGAHKSHTSYTFVALVLYSCSVLKPMVYTLATIGVQFPLHCAPRDLLCFAQYRGAGVVVCRDVDPGRRSLQSRSSHIILHLHTAPGDGITDRRGFKVMISGQNPLPHPTTTVRGRRTKPEAILIAHHVIYLTYCIYVLYEVWWS